MKSIKVLPKKRGRPATGKDPLLNFRAPPDLVERIEKWGRGQKPPIGKSAAARALIELGLASKK